MTAIDGVHASDKVKEQRYHLLMLCIKMLRMDRLQAVDLVKRSLPFTGTVVYCGMRDQRLFSNTMALDDNAYFAEPGRLEVILKTVRYVAEG